AHAALCGCCPAVGPGVLAGEDVLELDHAGVGEEQRRVIARHQRRRRHDLVPFRLEKGQEFLTDLGGFHSFGRWGKLAGHYIRFDTTNRASSRKRPAGRRIRTSPGGTGGVIPRPRATALLPATPATTPPWPDTTRGSREAPGHARSSVPYWLRRGNLPGCGSIAWHCPTGGQN